MQVCQNYILNKQLENYNNSLFKRIFKGQKPVEDNSVVQKKFYELQTNSRTDSILLVKKTPIICNSRLLLSTILVLMFLLPTHASLPLFGNDPSVALGGNLLTNSDITSSSATLHFSPNGIFMLGVGGSSGESTSGHSISGYGASIGFFPTTLSDGKIPIIFGLEFGISILSSGSTSIYGKSGGLIVGGFAEFDTFSIQPELVFAATSITAPDNTGVWRSSPVAGSILMNVPFAFEMGKNSFLLIGPAVGIADGTPVYGASAELNFKMD